MFARVRQRSGANGVFMWKTECQKPIGRCVFDGRILLKRIFKKWDGDMDRGDLADNRSRGRMFRQVYVFCFC
jgi:hypothetical protein